MTMGRAGRAIVPLLGAFTAVAIVVAGVAVTLHMQERNLRLAKERELVLVKAENDDLQQRLGELRTAKQQIEESLTRAKSQLDEAAQQLSSERQEKDELGRSVETRQREIERLSKDLEQARTEKSELSEQSAKLRAQLKNVQKQLAQSEKSKADMEAKSLDMPMMSSSFEQPTVSLDTVVVKNSGASPGMPSDSPAMTSVLPPGMPSLSAPSPVQAANVSSSQGQVVVVNRDYDFVVMNLGRNHGLQIGQEFQIVRGSEVVGRVKVEKVYDELAAAAILPDSKKDAIREGDLLKAI
jgi:uncharacterized phage infection (PIP) family protein YhgE